MFKPIFIFTLILFICPKTLAIANETAHKQQVIKKNIAKALRKIPDVPGISVAIYSEQFTLAQGFGVTSIETQEAVSSDTAFYIASSTKSITALAMAALHEKGELNLDASIKSFAPDAPFPASIDTDSITLRQLLAQASGITNVPIAHRLAYTGEHTPTQLWQALAFTENNIDNPTGEFQYSNYNYNILTLLTDRQLKRSWKDILTQDLFDKAGMTRTTAYMSKAEGEKWSIARPHEFTAQGTSQLYLEKQDNTMQSAGGVIMSANDAALWLELLIENGKVNGQQIVPVNAVLATRRAETPVDKTFLDYDRTYYGLGFYGGPYGENNDLMLHHFGSFAGSSAHVSYLPDRKAGVAIFANSDGLGIRLASIISHYIYSELADRPKADNQLHRDINKLVKQAKKQRKGLVHAAKEREKRQYQFSQPLQNYTGTYANDLYGNIIITNDQQHLVLSSGNLNVLSTPFPQQDAVRVEMIPGLGKILSFTLNEDNQVENLRVSGILYTRVDE